MKYQFRTTEEKLEEGVSMFRRNGGSISTETGFFSISGVEGQVAFKDNILTVVVTDKPFLASWGMIEDKLNEFFNN